MRYRFIRILDENNLRITRLPCNVLNLNSQLAQKRFNTPKELSQCDTGNVVTFQAYSSINTRTIYLKETHMPSLLNNPERSS